MRFVCLIPVMAICLRGEDLCRLSFRVTDISGETQEYKLAALDSAKGKSYLTSMKSLTGRVPCGVYYYVLDRIGKEWKIGSFRGSIEVKDSLAIWHVSNPNEWCAQDGCFSSSRLPASFAGRIFPAPEKNAEPHWVSVRGIAWDLRLDASVGENGSFTLPDRPRGVASIYVFRGAKVVHHRIVDFGVDGKTPPLVLQLE